ncbi:hypothetical protein [Acidithiobacillus ferriphilus]|uniref:hypothetical protein n=1 Tax=Acidithiobacillus ferriphilus TaxID=1689834 RepID=UPI002DB971CB|nr:hypothetical protein [Acidithiobacillus ferriphilus]
MKMSAHCNLCWKPIADVKIQIIWHLFEASAKHWPSRFGQIKLTTAIYQRALPGLLGRLVQGQIQIEIPDAHSPLGVLQKVSFIFY